MKRLRIGLIPFGNLFPIFHILRRDFECIDYDFIEGVPSALNAMLRRGDIDLSPSSSVEYLLHRDLYEYIPNHSISAIGKVGSIYLFSRIPIERLNGEMVSVTAQSAASIELFRVITREFYGIMPVIIKSSNPQADNARAFLLIGDDALRQFKVDNTGLYVYDLGELWHNHTGLPFVFALWIVRKDNIGEDKILLYERFTKELEITKTRALQCLNEIVDYCPLIGFMKRQEILTYWNNLDYELTERHIEGLLLFERLINKGNQ